MSQDTPQIATIGAVTVIRKSLRDAVEDTFWDLGGPEGLLKWTQESTVNKRIFYKDILPKLIPRELKGQITGDGGGPVKMVIEWAGDPPANAPASVAMRAVTDVIMASNDD